MLFPAQGDWTEEDYLALERGGNRLIELSDGCIEVLPMPNLVHQFILQYLFKSLDAFALARALGRVAVAPLPVHLWKGKYREPEIVFLRPERIRDLRKQPEGADLVMEIVSEGEENRDRDLVKKLADYARARIAEYWIVDPQEQRITVHTIEDDAYRVHGIFRRGQTASSVLLAGFDVSVDATFDAGEGT